MAGSNRGATSAFDDGPRKRPWWLLALLALIAIIALILLLRACGDDDGGDRTATPAETTQSVPEEAAPATPEGGAGTLTAGGTALLPAEPTALREAVGQDAAGERVRVQEVVPEEGFFVGTSETDRIYVEFGGDVGETEQGSNSYEPAEGDEVDLTGPVREAPAEPEQTLNLDADDAALVREQGVYVNADRVEPAQ
jgi:hypothetical protein